MKRILKCILKMILTIAIILSLAVGILWLMIPISRPRNAVRSYILRLIPIGTYWDDVSNILHEQSWEITTSYLNGGLAISNRTGSMDLAEENDQNNSVIDIIGARVMIVDLGEYWIPVNVGVYGYLVFDEDGYMMEAYIRKDYDSV